MATMDFTTKPLALVGFLDKECRMSTLSCMHCCLRDITSVLAINIDKIVQYTLVQSSVHIVFIAFFIYGFPDDSYIGHREQSPRQF